MKLITLTFFFLLLLTACVNDDASLNNTSDSKKNPYSMNLKDVSGIGTNTNFKAHLESIDGIVIEDVSQLSMKNEYYLIVESETPAFHRIGLLGGFEIIENLNDRTNPTNISMYKIRPSDEIANGLALSVILIHKSGDTYLRETPKRFILPE